MIELHYLYSVWIYMWYILGIETRGMQSTCLGCVVNESDLGKY